MSSSDDESDAVPTSVKNYYFDDENDEPISFAVLPLQWTGQNGDDVVSSNNNRTIFLRGTNGLEKIFLPVKAWKFDLEKAVPEVSVLTKEKRWIKLEKARKSYEEEVIRTVLITVYCLHYVRRNPQASGKSVWDFLFNAFRLLEVRPSQNDLVDHIDLISEAVKRDDSLSKCKFLIAFLEKPTKRILEDERKENFVVDDFVEAIEDAEEDGSNDDDDLFDSVCAFCDNGGDILCCDGVCMRSFHQSKEAGSSCDPLPLLGLTAREVKAIKTKSFECKNCKYKQHQCFACGKLGSSDKSSNPEVFKCASATCGYFYHPHCVAQLLHPKDGVAATELQEKIVVGEPFTCPIHKCCVCKQLENKKELDLQFAVCKRCPTSYHRKCLPREISLKDIEEEEIFQRAWEELLPNRILIYCLKHEIDDEILTPVRDHIIFPDVEEKNRKRTSVLPASKGEDLRKKRKLVSEGSVAGKSVVKSAKTISSANKVGVVNMGDKPSSGPDSLRKVISSDAPRKLSNKKVKSVVNEVDKFAASSVNKACMGDQLYDFYDDLCNKKSEQVKPAPESDHKITTMKMARKKPSIELPSLDAESERRILNLMKEAASSITLEDVTRKHELAATHMYSSRTAAVDKNITLGKVEGAVEAVKTALKKLDDGCSIEDAKVVCESEVLNQVFRWKNKLKVFLAPFLYGMRYSSFGRHFTKPEKLQEIADMLHWYVQDDDMIVDFCCGANDFSCLMKKKLEETGKKCSYRNYDLFHPKNDFNFVKKNWMTASRDELPEGSKLIMGLNPPFGVKAALANKFINKALEFKPKLLILIVPPETERLDRKNPPYDLVWEDNQFLSGKSFYLPGSVDAKDKQMEQWNVTPPPLYLWSRCDWSTKHKAIAEEHGHVSRLQKELNLGKDGYDTERPHIAMDYNHSSRDASFLTDDLPEEYKESKEVDCGMDVAEGRNESPPCNVGDRKSQDSRCPENKKFDESSKKRRHGDEKRWRETHDKSAENRLGSGRERSENRHVGGRPPLGNTHKGILRNSPSDVVDGRSSLDRPTSRSAEAGNHGFSDQHVRHGTAYGGYRASSQDDMDRRYNINSDEPYSSGVHRYSAGAGMEAHYADYMRHGAERASFRSYMELERQSDILSQGHYYGPDPNSPAQRDYLARHDLGYGQMGSLSSVPYRHLSSAPESSHGMGMSAMDRYAPRLDELNHTRMNSLNPEPPMMHRNDFYDPRIPPQPGYRGDSMGFAPGPYHPYPHHNSAGWLND